MIEKTTLAVLTAILTASHAYSTQEAAASAIVSNKAPETITIQEMLLNGPVQLKMHSLAMISQGNIEGDVDGSYLPGLIACSQSGSTSVRCITAKVLGQHYTKDVSTPNHEALKLLIKLAKDKSADVRYNAAYYGLTQIDLKDDKTISTLIDVATLNQDNTLNERIFQSLKSQPDKTVKILDERLSKGNDIAVFEIYEELTGKPPANADKFLDMPSSRPRLFIFTATGDNIQKSKAELTKELKAVGIMNPTIITSGSEKNHVLMVKTYITKEGIAVDKNFSKEGRFKISQQMWLTPELETQLETLRKAAQKQ